MTVRTKRSKHPHDDAPDTSAEFRRIAELPDGPQKDELRRSVVRAWMPMAGRLARHFRNRGEALEDLEQVAALGLVKAVARYDISRGCAFESFAVPTIVGEIKRHFRDHMWGLHVPRRVQELRNRVRIGQRELSHTLDGRSPSVQRIAEHTGLSEEDVLLGMEALESYSTLSLDAQLPGADDGYSLADTLGDAEPGYDRIVYREAVKPRLERLPERERRILYMRSIRCLDSGHPDKSSSTAESVLSRGDCGQSSFTRTIGWQTTQRYVSPPHQTCDMDRHVVHRLEA
ncbi:sigma-70 family RNA polymerase sigma factor [Streptomyces albus]|uniref:sigma-70 family RNA polymerase sigma factor n=1 Tax=Streptomyces albus TaxID=1888 RepID=UPI0021629AD5|nr:sigma-70 family RNA polymerase sigma factor [Streptomyces albus]UVN54073.1 sigma-70 family RNA polymerase sigma factor [Streptomyces albus]